jgi:hypothetical protein
MAGTLLVLPRKRGVPFSSSACRGGTVKMRTAPAAPQQINRNQLRVLANWCRNVCSSHGERFAPD